MTPEELLADLHPTVESLLDRHLAASKEWFPHELVPWSRGRDFDPHAEWSPDYFPLPTAVRDALFVNLLTEDNLPHYFATINNLYGGGEAWGAWSKRWTAEEGRHSIVIRDYLVVTRAIDPVSLERARMAQVTRGEVPRPDDPRDGLAYVALQELATRIAHLNTGRLIDDEAGYEVMKRVATDENRHHLFYRDLVGAALTIDPSGMVVAIDRQVRGFEMPGTGIVGFAEMAKGIAKAGVYDLRVHLEQILEPVLLTHWKVDTLTGLDAEGQAAQESIARHLLRLAKVVQRMEARASAKSS
jgi:acyl-[acyl-carrier-protein] desaturase